jgi:hypothetical protein
VIFFQILFYSCCFNFFASLLHQKILWFICLIPHNHTQLKASSKLYSILKLPDSSWDKIPGSCDYRFEDFFSLGIITSAFFRSVISIDEHRSLQFFIFFQVKYCPSLELLYPDAQIGIQIMVLHTFICGVSTLLWTMNFYRLQTQHPTNHFL